MMTTTCLIGVVVWMLVMVPRSAVRGEAVAAAVVSTVATSPSAATALTCLISFRFIGLPSPSVGELSRCCESAEGYLRARAQHGGRTRPPKEQKVTTPEVL